MQYNPDNQWTPNQAESTNSQPLPSYTYNIAPAPRNSSIFGGVPGAISLPQPHSDLARVYPGLTETSSATSGDILDKLNGKLGGDTLDALQNNNAERAVAGGQSGSGLFQNALLSDVGHASQAQQAGGLGDYGTTIPTVSTTQTTAPSFQAELAQLNAINAAAPNPFMQQLAGLGGSFGGFALGGGFGSPSVGTLESDLNGGNAFGMGDGFEQGGFGLDSFGGNLESGN